MEHSAWNFISVFSLSDDYISKNKRWVSLHGPSSVHRKWDDSVIKEDWAQNVVNSFTANIDMRKSGREILRSNIEFNIIDVCK